MAYQKNVVTIWHTGKMQLNYGKQEEYSCNMAWSVFKYCNALQWFMGNGYICKGGNSVISNSTYPVNRGVL